MGSRKQLQKSSMEHLPDDVLLNNIFIRLPAKQLAQMRSLSKLWNSFLSQPSFVKSHLHHSICNNDEILIVFDDDVDIFSYTTHLSRSPNLQLTNLIKPPSRKDLDSRGHVIGSVNGLICFSKWNQDDNNVIHIWNPSISALVALPSYTIPFKTGYEILFQFGFDPKTNDYKLVKLTFFEDVPIMQKDTLQVEVYSMRKGCWETISERCNFPSHVTIIYSNLTVSAGLDGHFHWIGDVHKHQTIVSFDLGVETFSEISLPDSIQDTLLIGLGVWSHKLCVMSCKADGDCEVWVMEKYGVAKSWVKKHVFSHMVHHDDILPIGFTLNNDLLFEVDGRLALFDPNEAVVKLFKTNKKRLYSLTTVVRYVDSLVWAPPL